VSRVPRGWRTNPGSCEQPTTADHATAAPSTIRRSLAEKRCVYGGFLDQAASRRSVGCEVVTKNRRRLGAYATASSTRRSTTVRRNRAAASCSVSHRQRFRVRDHLVVASPDPAKATRRDGQKPSTFAPASRVLFRDAVGRDACRERRVLTGTEDHRRGRMSRQTR
jgi:hypothetical protein